MPSPFLLLFGLPGTTYFFLDSVFALNASFRSLICTLGRKLTGAKLLLYFFFLLTFVVSAFVTFLGFQPCGSANQVVQSFSSSRVYFYFLYSGLLLSRYLASSHTVNIDKRGL